MAESQGLTLTDVTYVGRKAVTFSAIALVVLIVGRVFWGAFITYWRATHPPPPPPPTVGFGLLPQLRFPEKSESQEPVSYKLESASGGLPNLGDRLKVFLMPASDLSLLADERARQIAADYGYVFEPEILSSRLYRWRKSQPLESTLQLDIQTLQLKLTTNYLTQSDLLSTSQLPNNTRAVSTVKDFLGTADLLPSDLATASGEIVYLKAVGAELEEAVSFSDADFIQVDINRIPIDNAIRMYTPNGLQGVVSAVVGGNFSGRDNIYQLSFNYHSVDYDQVHTYPLRTTQDAWRILQAGEGYVAEKGESDTAIVRTVSLGYYDDFEEQEYLQPIYVFEGDDGFLGYVPAVDPEWIQSNAVSN